MYYLRWTPFSNADFVVLYLLLAIHDNHARCTNSYRHISHTICDEKATSDLPIISSVVGRIVINFDVTWTHDDRPSRDDNIMITIIYIGTYLTANQPENRLTSPTRQYLRQFWFTIILSLLSNFVFIMIRLYLTYRMTRYILYL